MKVHNAGILKLPRSVLTIGALDGVHRGHQALINCTRDRANKLGVPMVVYTFDPPPRVYLQNSIQLTTLSEKLNRLRILGVDHVVVATFNADYATRGVNTFLDEITGLNPLEIFEGPDFRFGSNRDGDINTLRERFTVRVLDPIRCNSGKTISSSRIRRLLMQGNHAQAKQLLGWPLKSL